MLGQIGFADFIKVEGDLVFAEVAGEGDAVAVGDFAADARFPDGDGAVARNELRNSSRRMIWNS